ncbi:hypothetical protein Tco_1135502 [Tanacetum coccineum]
MILWKRELEGRVIHFYKEEIFVCGSLSHLIKDCDYYEKKMAREAEVKRVVNTGNGVTKPVWTNANRINHSNKFVPRSVQLNAGRPKFNSVRPNINTGRTNISSGSPKVNTVIPRQPAPHKTLNSLKCARRQTAQMAHTNVVMGSWGSAVKTSASYNWRNSRPNFNYNSGPTSIRTEHPLKNMVDRGIFDSGCSGHMIGNKDQLEDFEEFNGGSVTFGGEEQVEDISPNTLEAAKTLSKVASLKPRKRGAKQIHLDSLLAQRIAEDEELNEQQKKRKAQVQFEAQHYTNEDWDLIRAKIETNAELSKSMLGSELQGEDFAKKMVDLVNQRKKYFAEERARAKRNKPMTQSQLKTYMMNYLKNQGTWKLSQLKNLSFEEVKEEFDKLVKQVESFAPMNFEATKASLKRFGEELQTKTPKRMKDDEAKDDEPTKKSGKRRKQMARRGLHTNIDKDDSEGSDEVSEQDDSVTGTKIPINPVPVAMKTPSIATYKIIKQGEKGVYQIVREDGTDIVYINFGAMLKSISRDDLTELYRIVMNRYGMDGPEDELEKVFWKCLKTMFEEPLSTDPIWSELGQQKIISWRYYESCRVHCLNLESMDIYMLIERTYPLSAEMCKAMLDKKLQGGKPDENCYKMLKMMEKQAGIRK